MTWDQAILYVGVLGGVLSLLPKIVKIGIGNQVSDLEAKVDVIDTRTEERHNSTLYTLNSIHEEIKGLRGARHDFVGMVQRHEGIIGSIPIEVDRVQMKTEKLEIRVDRIENRVEKLETKVS